MGTIMCLDSSSEGEFNVRNFIWAKLEGLTLVPAKINISSPFCYFTNTRRILTLAISENQQEDNFLEFLKVKTGTYGETLRVYTHCFLEWIIIYIFFAAFCIELAEIYNTLTYFICRNEALFSFSKLSGFFLGS